MPGIFVGSSGNRLIYSLNYMKCMSLSKIAPVGSCGFSTCNIYETDCLSNKPTNKYLWWSSTLVSVCCSFLLGSVFSIFQVKSTQKIRNSTRKNSKKYEISTVNNSSTPERKWFIDFEYNNINGIMNIFHIFLFQSSPQSSEISSTSSQIQWLVPYNI